MDLGFLLAMDRHHQTGRCMNESGLAGEVECCRLNARGLQQAVGIVGAAGQGACDLDIRQSTDRVTSSDSRSLSGCNSLAGTRRIAGCPGRSTALAIMVAAASAVGTSSAKTVTASEIPSEKLRPWRPLVAMPRIGSRLVMVS